MGGPIHKEEAYRMIQEKLVQTLYRNADIYLITLEYKWCLPLLQIELFQ